MASNLCVLGLIFSFLFLILKLRQNHVHLVLVKMLVLLFACWTKARCLQISALSRQTHLELFKVNVLDPSSNDLVELHSCRRIVDISFTLAGNTVSIDQGAQAVVKLDGNCPELSRTFVN